MAEQREKGMERKPVKTRKVLPTHVRLMIIASWGALLAAVVSYALKKAGY